MALTDLEIRSARPREKAYRMTDGAGMYLEVSPSGGKHWRLKYRFAGKEKRLALGAYPLITIKDARKRRDDARRLLANGVDPGLERRIQKAAAVERAENSFECVAREWFARQAPTWAKSHADKVIARLENDVLPWLGGRPISEITPPEILAVLRRVEKRGAVDTAHRVQQNIGQVLRYGVATGRVQRDASADLRGALTPVQHTHFASITDPEQVAGLLRALDGFQGTFVVQCALRLAPLVFVRPGELRNAEWTDFDLDRATWRYQVSKTRTDHLVPLSVQAVRILRDLNALTGHRRYVFVGRDVKKPMSGAAINAALRRMGFDTKTEITGHGFRAMARTILHEQLRFPAEVIEHQLAHRVADSLGTAYNRTRFIDERVRMMQAWADYLDDLKAGERALPEAAVLQALS
ncbi:phage integrase central domain-containing protein [Caballeronia sp. LZ035]|uniref:tyrosine-type recombinase/integrase n=1 Tax=Caballeronia sp. LZ035 TaxID=3038568 RepID=UPI00285E4A88|nr:integrase arm-type DNA-binding domain-containing protein [Caballeronia sp. LZ035]MDR5755597.1 integrase arm-type DNA-binding domain-containing protein [Caballeronia sp. LZ035]